MQVVIISGGKGTRLRARTGALPKSLVEICGSPLIDHQLRIATLHGGSDVVLLLGYGADSMRAYCGDGSRWGARIRYVVESEPLGAAGAVLNALPELADRFIVMYGDTFVDVDLTRMWRKHEAVGPDATLLVHPNDHPRDSDLVEMDDSGRIVAFHPYPHPEKALLPNLVNGALYVLERKPLESMAHNPKVLDFGKHVFPQMLHGGCFLYGYRSPEYIKDAGTPERLDQVTADVLSGRTAGRNLATAAPAVFLDRDGTINQECGRVDSVEQFELIDDVAAGIRDLNRSEYRTVVVTNQPVIARGDCDESGLRNIHNKMETLLGREGAYLDAIYYCPHHPDRGFPNERKELKFDCVCRKPKTGMIETATADLNIDLERAWMIGDSTVDVETARRAGVKSILLRTGLGGRDGKYPSRPDFEFFTFREAVRFLLEDWPVMIRRAGSLIANISGGRMILVGGRARSGKSTWASVLKYALRERGINGEVVHLDAWLKAEAEREGGRDVRDRYDLPAAERFLENLRRNGGCHRMPSYNRYDRSSRPDGAEISVGKDDVIIVEGVVALLSPALLASASLKLFVACPEPILRDTFFREYLHRGYAVEDIEKLYGVRLLDEAPLVESCRSASDTLIERL